MEAETLPDSSDYESLIAEMDDLELLCAYKAKEDYEPLFTELAAKHLTDRGYAVPEVDAAEDMFGIAATHKTDGELIEIYKKYYDYDERWDAPAQAELQRRGVDLARYREERHVNEQTYAKGKEGQYIGWGYFFSVLGGIIGLCFAINYGFRKETREDGRTYYKYNGETRKNGHIMLWISIVSIIFQIGWKLSEEGIY